MAVWSQTVLSSIENSWGRLDAEYYKPEFLETENLLSKIDGVKLRNSCCKIDVGHVGPMVRFYSDNGIILLQTQNVREFFLDLQHCIKITPDFHKNLTKSQVQKGDILIARSGSFGTAAIYLEDQIINSADIIIVELNDPKIDPLFAVTFMNTKYGFNQLIRFASGGVQGHINLRILENLFLPTLAFNLQKEISTNVQRAYDALKVSAESYQQAQHLLESELGLDKLKFKKPVGYTVRFGDIYKSGRFDADYYQPQFDAISQIVNNYHNGYKPLIYLATPLKPNTDPSKIPNQLYNYIELSNINPNFGTVDGFESMLGKDLPSRARRQVKHGDVIASSVVGSADKVAVIDSNRSGFIASTGFFHFRPVNVSPEYLLILVSSKCVRMQFQQQSTGGILSAVPDNRLKNVIVPNLPELLQREIANLVIQSHKAKRESEKLLNQAKTRVEQLIEEAAEQ